MQTSIFSKIQGKYHVDELTGCWEWDGSKRKGYGSIRHGKTLNGKRKRFIASRVSWELHNGMIPSGMFVCHHCDNPSCINPDHLFLGGVKENAQDASKKFRLAMGERNTKSKLTDCEVMEIRSSGEPSFVLCKRYRVHRNTIWRVKRKISWRHI